MSTRAVIVAGYSGHGQRTSGTVRNLDRADVGAGRNVGLTSAVQDGVRGFGQPGSSGICPPSRRDRCRHR
jgi:hypothetical protein